MYCGIWGLISFPSSSSSAGASPALRASSNSNCFLWSSLDLNAAANQIWPSSQDHHTHKNSHISKFGCKAVCQIQRTKEFHNYQGKETSTDEERERERESRSVWKLARLNNLSHIMPLEIGFQKFRTEEREKKAPTKTQWKRRRQRRPNTHTHTQSGKKREKGMATIYMMRLPWFLVLTNCRILKAEYLPNEFLAQMLVCNTPENRRRRTRREQMPYQSAKP
jgi:hypothetical protein